ncbi:hypothetical protein EVAR_20928_1 [Eumeta japonica]|uniref:Uncharacterized protein n=1 Tax=Eumeta variegata TaxID=151549 RepID=A0A4C1UVK8_EUMVA|nr:hypothetical protein EVAR_20928_1 [Eumeta japonica]
MSIPHTLAPVRVSSVGLKPTKKYPPEGEVDGSAMLCSQTTGRTTGRTTMIALPCAAGRHVMSPETVTGRFPFLLPSRERSAVAGWSKGYRSMT